MACTFFPNIKGVTGVEGAVEMVGDGMELALSAKLLCFCLVKTGFFNLVVNWTSSSLHGRYLRDNVPVNDTSGRVPSRPRLISAHERNNGLFSMCLPEYADNALTGTKISTRAWMRWIKQVDNQSVVQVTSQKSNGLECTWRSSLDGEFWRSGEFVISRISIQWILFVVLAFT